MHLIAVIGEAVRSAATLAPGAAEAGGLTINLFWVIVAALNFIVFFALAWIVILKPLVGRLADRRSRIEQGLSDAEAAHQARARAEEERLAAIQDARREAREIVDRAQKVAQEAREADIAATREELERLRARAATDIEAEKARAIADLRSEVAGLALEAAGRVVRETMSGERQRRLVEEFLAEPSRSEPR